MNDDTRFTLRISNDLSKLLDIYVVKNKLKSKNEAIINILNLHLKNGETFKSFQDLDRKLERLLKLESLNKILLEQSFCNHGFPINMDRKEDMRLQELYEDMKKSYVIFME